MSLHSSAGGHSGPQNISNSKQEGHISERSDDDLKLEDPQDLQRLASALVNENHGHSSDSIMANTAAQQTSMSHAVVDSEQTMVDSMLTESTSDRAPETGPSLVPLENPTKLLYTTDSYHEVRDELNEWAGPRGYCLKLANAKKDPKTGIVSRVRLLCDRAGKHRPARANQGLENGTEDGDVKPTSRKSKLQDCPWRCHMVRRVNEVGQVTWELSKPRRGAEWPEHNHGPVEDLTSLVLLRQHAMRGEIGRTILELSQNVDIKPGVILETLNKKFGPVALLPKDIYRIRTQARRKNLLQAPAGARAIVPDGNPQNSRTDPKSGPKNGPEIGHDENGLNGH